MNDRYKIGVLAALLAVSACTDYTELTDYQVEKPLSVEQQEQIDAYDDLLAYVNGDFKLGTNISMETYTAKGYEYRLVNRNFNEINTLSDLQHGAAVSLSGGLSVQSIGAFAQNAAESGVDLYGRALIGNRNQNAEYLNATIAPTIIPAVGGPAWEEQVNLDFETDDATGYQSNGADAVLSFTADGGGADGTGRALVVTNSEVRTDDWRSQLFVTFATPTEEGDVYRLTMDVRADAAATMATQAQTGPGAYKHWNFFGAISATTEWSTVEVEITVGAETSGCNTIAFNLGNTATNYYFDNVTVDKFNENAGGPVWEVLSEADFESDNGTNYESNGPNAELSFSADGGGANGSGRALVVTNAEVRTDDWRSQLFFTFGQATEEGQQFRLTMDVRADAAATMATQAQTAPGAYKHWNFFGAISATTEWSTVSVDITIGAETSGCNTIAFNLGNTATNYYFDNIAVSWYNEDGGGEQIIEMTPEEKSDTLTYAMTQWITGIMAVTSEHVKTWEVVSNPLSDVAPYEVNSGAGQEQAGDEFYWQDYLGDDYAVTAFKLARENAGDGAKLFISESNLVDDLAKCDALVDYIAYIEGEGVVIDGVSAQLSVLIDQDLTEVEAMFEKLAATGKMIRIADFAVSLGDADMTQENLYLQSEMYKQILDAYGAKVPAGQRYGVSLSELPELWYSNSYRKPSYAGFADGLSDL